MHGIMHFLCDCVIPFQDCVIPCVIAGITHENSVCIIPCLYKHEMRNSIHNRVVWKNAYYGFFESNYGSGLRENPQNSPRDKYGLINT